MGTIYIYKQQTIKFALFGGSTYGRRGGKENFMRKGKREFCACNGPRRSVTSKIMGWKESRSPSALPSQYYWRKQRDREKERSEEE